jgi:hypothetical protein
VIPDYFEAITAYRCWDVFPNGLLCGQAVQEPWPMFQPMVARCAAAGSANGYAAHVSDLGDYIDAPVFACDCGVHAYRTLEEAERRITADPNAGYVFHRPSIRAWGALKLWGKLVEHEQGYRAQFAYPSDLFCEDEALALKVSALYGVPCVFKAIARPEMRDDNTGMSIRFLNSYNIPFQPFTIPNSWTSGWMTYPTSPLSPCVIQTPSFSQVKALGLSKHQRKESARREAQKEESAAKKRDLIQKYRAMGAINVECDA